MDAKFVTPYLPTVLSLKGKIDVATLSFLQRKTRIDVYASATDQVDLFKQYFAQPPAEAPWTPDNTLFAIWIGINE